MYGLYVFDWWMCFARWMFGKENQRNSVHSRFTGKIVYILRAFTVLLFTKELGSGNLPNISESCPIFMSVCLLLKHRKNYGGFSR